MPALATDRDGWFRVVDANGDGRLSKCVRVRRWASGVGVGVSMCVCVY